MHGTIETKVYYRNCSNTIAMLFYSKYYYYRENYSFTIVHSLMVVYKLQYTYLYISV